MRRLKAQQITEFMLAVPLMIIFLAVLTEYAFTFNAHLVLSNALRSGVGPYIGAISSNASPVDYENAVREYVLQDMQNNRIPNLGSLEVSIITVDKYPSAIGTYTYRPGFGFSFLPALRSIRMNSVSVFPFDVPQLEGYAAGLSDVEMNLLAPEVAEDAPFGAAAGGGGGAGGTGEGAGAASAGGEP